MAWIDVCPSCHGIIGRDCWNPQECAQITAQMQFEPVREGRPDEAEALRRAGYQRKMDITEALMGPHEWGYRDPVEGGFMPDSSPFVAAELISELRAQLAGSQTPSASDGEAISEGDIATEHKASPPPALEAGDLEWLRSVVGRAGGGAVAQSQAFYKHRDRILAALSPAPLQEDQLVKLRGWKPTHRHVKRGSDYQVIGSASLQAAEPIGEAATLVIYRDQKGHLWARPEVEFDDGRFEALSATGEE